MEEATLVLHLRPSRIRAKAAAAAEAVSLLRDLGASAPNGGPLSERKGVLWIALPADRIPLALPRLPRLGYTRAVDVAEPVSNDDDSGPPGEARVRWRKQTCRLRRVCEEDPDALREAAPDRRSFLFEAGDGSVREIHGYRGDGGPLSRRGLPVCDARLLVNLAAPVEEDAIFLDPFAGAGGLVLEARGRGWRTLSADIDPRLRHGLSRIADLHCVADARGLPFVDGSIDAVAAEPPYDPQADQRVEEALREMARTLRPGGRIALLAAERQAESLRRAGEEDELIPILDSSIDRKGLAVVALAWRRPAIP